MSALPKLNFAKPAAPRKGVVVLFAGEEARFGARASQLDADSDGAISRALDIAGFKGKRKTAVDIFAPAGLPLDRVLVVGLGDPETLAEQEWAMLGGFACGKLTGDIKEATVFFELPGGDAAGADAAAFAMGAKLAAYRFRNYKTKPPENGGALRRLTLQLDDTRGAKKAFAVLDAVSDGTLLARDLVNEPANALGPVEFAARAAELSKLGVEIEVLDEKALRRQKMNALLAVGQGSERESRVVVMRWNGGAAKARPLAFVGKGVVFDTGGISIKPAAGMEDMKGDMAGAACVVGLMHALAARKAKVNAVGIIGLVENMPDGKAQRPGDIVTSMSGQTIEIINTDAEGRLVLADLLTYIQKTAKPAFMVNLATLTGAIIVALGHEHAGLFSNDDELSERLSAAGRATGEKVWRMPLDKAYDKLIDSRFADMKNTGGRWAGSVTAAQFLQRFVEDVPWAHLDIAGTGFESPQNDINKSWASGFGVRLLDRLVAESYEG